MPGSLHIFVTSFFRRQSYQNTKNRLRDFHFHVSVFASLALLSKKVNKLLCNILVTRCQKQPKTKLRKWDEKLTRLNFVLFVFVDTFTAK